MIQNYEWYNNGSRNIKIFNGEEPPTSFNKGYIVVKSIKDRLKRVQKIYEKELKDFINIEIGNIEKKLLRINQKFLNNQQKICPETVSLIHRDFIPPEQLKIIKDSIFDELEEKHLEKQSKILNKS